MLLQFNVTNFLSFKDENVLSLLANADTSHNDSLISFKGEKVLPVTAVYGANAAGKSNLHKALTAAVMMVRESNNLQYNQPLQRIIPFLLDNESRNNKTRFDFIFTNCGMEYEYGFTVDRNFVYEEYLYEYKTAKPSLIFERSNISEYKFTAVTRKTLEPYVSKNTNNKLFLSTATAWNCELTRNAYTWFSDKVDTYDSSNLETLMFDELEKCRANNDMSMNTFILNLLHGADIHIESFNYNISQRKLSDLPVMPGVQLDPSFFGQGDGMIKEQHISTVHKVINGNTSEYYPMPYESESNGTKKLFTYGPIIKNALEMGKTISIDEIDTALHPSLTKLLIEMFMDPEMNRNGAQLIFNTHEVGLLDLDLFRRDQIYFVEKNQDTASSDLYSLDEFSPRKTENIQKGYLQGRYGAIPVVNLGDIKW